MRQDAAAISSRLRSEMHQSPISFSSAKKQGLSKPSEVATKQEKLDSGSGGDSYEEDEFMDGEESTSKEVKRSAFDIESITENRLTPGTNNQSIY